MAKADRNGQQSLSGTTAQNLLLLPIDTHEANFSHLSIREDLGATKVPSCEIKNLGIKVV
ncbi:MAG: hypothetical protein ACYDD1_02235 [Caulobacteraceae bacterium]